MSKQFVGGGKVVDEDVVDGQLRYVDLELAENHHRHAGIEHGRKVVRTHLEGRGDDAIDPRSKAGADRAQLFLAQLIGVVGRQVVTVDVGHVLDAAFEGRVEGVGDIRDETG